MIKGIAFDLEGTIVDLEKAHHMAHLAVCKEAGLNISLQEAIIKIPHFIGGPDEAIMQDIKSLTNTSLSITEMLKLDRKIYEENLKSTAILPRNGFSKVIESLKKKNLPVAIGSLTHSVDAKFIMEKSNILKFFDYKNIIFKEDVQNLKPSPDVYLKTAKTMNISPTEQIVFEDSPNGIKAAKAAGSIAIGMPVYNSQEVVSKLIQAGAYKVFYGWDEININSIIEELDSNLSQ